MLRLASETPRSAQHDNAGEMLSSAFAAAVIPSGLRAHEESLLPTKNRRRDASTPLAARKRDARPGPLNMTMLAKGQLKLTDYHFPDWY